MPPCVDARRRDDDGAWLRSRWAMSAPKIVNDKRTLYVGGLEESVTTEILHAAFLPFGEITDVNLVLDSSTQKHRGFAFVQFEDRGDAADAIDNMNNAELFGRVLKVNVAKPSAAVGGHRPVWESQADTYYKDKKEEGDGGDAEGETGTS